MGSCCGSALPAEKLDILKNKMFSRNETIIVDWAKSTYVGGAFGNRLKEGVTCLTNRNFYFVAKDLKIEQSLKKILEVKEEENYREKKHGKFTVFKLEKGDFAMVFLENKEKLNADCKILIAEKYNSPVIEYIPGN